MTANIKVYSKRGKRVPHRTVLISGGGLVVGWANLDIGTLGALLSTLDHHGSVAPLVSQLAVSCRSVDRTDSSDTDIVVSCQEIFVETKIRFLRSSLKH